MITVSAGRPRVVSLVIGLCIFAALATFLYWLLWFAAPEAVQARPNDACYIIFEQSFPLADSWFAIAALVGAFGLWQRKDWGFLFVLLAGSAGIFLGLMDLLYDLENGTFAAMSSEAAIELGIVVLLLTLSPVLIILVWRQRKLFLHP